ncbi:MAG TPA: hypothetical protein VGP36_16810 [Mycobacteriales bacterium]|jgi:hypothetical protein|nr:hypothetical protein [Mycobacteriales bacterium]
MNSLNPTLAATSPVMNRWTGKVALEARCAAATPSVKGTGLPFATYEGGPSFPSIERTRPSSADHGMHFGAVGVMGADQVKTAALIPTVAVQGDPPRRTPPRC